MEHRSAAKFLGTTVMAHLYLSSESLTLLVVPQMFALQWKTQGQWWTETLMAKTVPMQKEPPNGQRKETDLRGSPVRRNHKAIRVRASF